MTLTSFMCSRCRLILELDPPEQTADNWYVVDDLIVHGGCTTPHEREHSPSLATIARNELLRRFRARREAA